MSNERTAIIFQECESIIYFVVDGDYTHLHDTYIGSVDSNDRLIDMLKKLIYNQENGKYVTKPCTIDYLRNEIVHGAYLIEAGFLS